MQGEGERGTHIHCWWEGRLLLLAIAEISMEVTKKARNRTAMAQLHHSWAFIERTPYPTTDPAICVHCCYIHHSAEMKSAKGSINGWMQ